MSSPDPAALIADARKAAEYSCCYPALLEELADALEAAQKDLDAAKEALRQAYEAIDAPYALWDQEVPDLAEAHRTLEDALARLGGEDK
jgi:uncharacterized membrane protein YccC